MYIEILIRNGKINNGSNQNITDINTIRLSSLASEEEKFSTLSFSQLLARGGVPASHKRIADNYIIIKKIYGFSSLQARISNAEKALLAKYDFNLLEYSTMKQINEELSFLKKWSYSADEELRNDADELLNIRAKELKFLIASYYPLSSEEIYNGYLALETYFEDISKY